MSRWSTRFVLLVVVLGIATSAFAQALLEPTNETLVFDVNGKNLGKLIGADQLRFRKPDGSSRFLVLENLKWKKSEYGFSGPDCSGTAYLINGTAPIDGANRLYDIVTIDMFTIVSYMNTAGNCANIPPFADIFDQVQVYVDLDLYYTEPFHYGGPPVPAVPSFSDVPTSSIFYQSVELMKASGVTVGCGGGKFCPDSAVTRKEMAAFIAQALGLRFTP